MSSRWGYRDGLANPCMQIERYKEKRHNRFLNQVELSRLWDTLDQYEQSGCRLGEIRTLKWSYIKGHHIEFPDSKTGYKRLPINNEVLAILKQIPRLKNNEYVICGSIEGQPIINLQKSWRRVRARAGLDDVRIHDLRHTFASQAVMGGTPLAIVSKLLGHSQISTTMRYAHLADAELSKASEAIGSILRAEKSKTPIQSNIVRMK